MNPNIRSGAPMGGPSRSNLSGNAELKFNQSISKVSAKITGQQPMLNRTETSSESVKASQIRQSFQTISRALSDHREGIGVKIDAPFLQDLQSAVKSVAEGATRQVALEGLKELQNVIHTAPQNARLRTAILTPLTDLIAESISLISPSEPTGDIDESAAKAELKAQDKLATPPKRMMIYARWG